jgi:hypothetical protein
MAGKREIEWTQRTIVHPESGQVSRFRGQKASKFSPVADPTSTDTLQTGAYSSYTRTSLF